MKYLEARNKIATTENVKRKLQRGTFVFEQFEQK
jgi:hypothetical protein